MLEKKINCFIFTEYIFRVEISNTNDVLKGIFSCTVYNGLFSEEVENCVFFVFSLWPLSSMKFTYVT